ncbi:MAG TPA: AEC family transporter [Pantanalinema sp.]
MWSTALLFALMIAAGYAFRRLRLVGPDATRDINQLVLNFCLPVLVFLSLHHATLSWSYAVIPAIAWFSILLGAGAGWVIARLGRLSKAQAGAVMLLMAFGNTAFIGYPVLSALYGPDHLTVGIFYDQLGTSVLLNTLGIAIASGASGASVRPLELVRKLLAFPPLYALVLGFALHGVSIAPWLEGALLRVADMTTPLIMFSLGLAIRPGNWRQDSHLVGAVVLVRLVLVPLAVLAAARLFGLPPAFLQASVLQAAMPAMLSCLSIAVIYGLDVVFVVNGLMATLFCGLVTLPVWYWLLGL